MQDDRISEGSIRLVVPKRKQDSVAELGAGEDAETRAEALLGRLDRTFEPPQRARILVELSTVLEELDDEAQAIDALLEAWKADPTHEAILDRLEPLVRRQHRWDEVLELTRTLAGAERQTARSLAYHEAMVRWLTRDQPNGDLARQWVERIRVIDPTHALVHFVQAAVAREHGDKKREIDELDLAVLSTRRKDDRVRIHLLLAARYLEDERTRNRAEAKKQYEQAHRLFPAMMEPLQGLEQLAAGDNLALADVLRRQADADVGEEDRLAILFRLARLEEEEFRRPELAARTLERIVARSSGRDDMRVLDALERCYRAARMWSELLVVLERAAIGDPDPASRTARLARLGEVLASKLGDVRAALATYLRLNALLPEDETVLGELARIAEKVGDVPLAVQCRERLATLATEPAVRARHNLIAGQLLTPIDPVAARRYFEAASKADASNASAWNALLWDARAENDLARVERYLLERANATETPRARAAAFVELAEVRARRGDVVGERDAWEAAIFSDPHNEAAAITLLEPYVREERFAEAAPLVDVVVAAAERDRDVYRVYSARRAQTLIGAGLGQPDLALHAALAAFELRGEEDNARLALVLSASAMRADPLVLSARDALSSIASRPEGLPVDARVALAEVLALVGEGDRAALLYDEVLVEAPEHERALAGLSQHHAASGNRVAALALKRQRAHAIGDLAERRTTLLETAEAFLRIDEDALAAEVYEEARQLAPRELPILHKLLGLYQRQSKWASLFDVLRSIAEVDVDPQRRAKTLFTMGQLASRELLDRGTALELFDRTLDVDPSQLEAFERIARILTEDRDWASLEQMYRKMIARAESRNDRGLGAVLHKQLGLVYRDRLGDAPGGIAALQRATQLAPKDEEAQAMLRELLASVGQASGAAAITLDRVLAEPMDPRPYPALFELLATQHRRDRAICVASAMHFLDVVHPIATQWRESFPPPPVDDIPLDLGEKGFGLLLHPELDPTVTEILRTCAPAVVEIALARLGLRERMAHPGPALKGQEWLAKTVARAASVLGAPSPKLYLRKTPGPPLAAAATKPPSLLVYTPGLAGVSREVLAFLVGKRILELTPPLVARALCPSLTELKALVASAARIATGHADPSDDALRARLRKEDVARIAEAVERSMAQGGKLDVLRWSQLADLSVSRAGLLLCGDLEAARMAIALEPQAPSDLNPRDKMRDLVAWFLGDACAELRKRLGVAAT